MLISKILACEEIVFDKLAWPLNEEDQIHYCPFSFVCNTQFENIPLDFFTFCLLLQAQHLEKAITHPEMKQLVAFQRLVYSLE